MYEKYIAARNYIATQYPGEEASTALRFYRMCEVSGIPEALTVGRMLLAWAAGKAAKPTGPNQRTGKGTWARRF